MMNKLGVLLAMPAAAGAQEGHGTAGTHGHAGDTWGLVLLLGAVAAFKWWGRRK